MQIFIYIQILRRKRYIFYISKLTIFGYYFFAYFIVDRVVAWGHPDALGLKDQTLVQKNHHFICKRMNQVVIVGEQNKSQVFKKAVLLSSFADKKRSNYFPCLSIQKSLGGYNKSMNLSSLRRFSDRYAESFKEYLDFRCK